MRNGLLVLTLLLTPFAAGPAEAGAEAPSDWTYQGQLKDAAGAPAEGLAEVELRLLDPAGAPLYVERHERVPVEAGLFALRLGDGQALAGELTNVAAIPGWVEVWVDGEPLGPPEQALAPAAGRDLAVDPPSPELRVFDGEGSELGVYAGERIHGGEQYFVHDPGVGLTFALQRSTGELGLAGLEIYYETADCQGQGFVDRRLSGVVFQETPAGYRVGTATQALRPLLAGAVLRADGRCEAGEQPLGEVVPITVLESIPLELPLAGPLHVGIRED